MYFHIACTNEEDPIKMNTLKWPQHYKLIVQTSRTDNSIVNGGIWLKVELMQAFYHVLLICKNEEDPIKMKFLEWPNKSMMGFPEAQGQLTWQTVIGSG